MIRFAPEGYPFIAISLLMAISSYLFIGQWITGLPVLLALFMLFFFRDPERKIPRGEDFFVSPADGRIIIIKDVTGNGHLNNASKQISIFMSPLDVHVNRAPCDGEVKIVKHNKGSFLAAYKDNASLKNENIEMVLATKYGDILVRQVAGYVARRAVCRVKAGEKLRAGERYGIIKFSSRLDVYLPKDTIINVKLGDKARAGETILGYVQKRSP